MTLAQSFWPTPRGSFCPVMATGGLCVAAVAVSAPGVPPCLVLYPPSDLPTYNILPVSSLCLWAEISQSKFFKKPEPRGRYRLLG